jgi:hypothetical protein
MPVLFRGVGKRLVTLHIVGSKSGRRHTVPVAFTAPEGILLMGRSFAWGLNLRNGESVEVRLKGKRVLAEVLVLTHEAALGDEYAVIARSNRTFAQF